jgi:16S rRNA (guanine1207-N2)-methyltransferase
VLAAHRPEAVDALRGSLAAWRTVAKIEIAGSPRAWTGYPGCFAAGRLDEGTALLIAHLPRLAPGVRVLDYGCGTGPIAAAVLAEQPSALVDALDSDSVALEAVRENVPAARPILGTRLADAGRRDYGAILSNPPLHQDIVEDHRLLDRLLTEAPAHLAPGGCLQIVVQRRVSVERQLARHLARVETLAETSRYRVWRGTLRA